MELYQVLSSLGDVLFEGTEFECQVYASNHPLRGRKDAYTIVKVF